MKSNTYTTVRFIAALLTILAITGQSYIPQKRLLIHPRDTTTITPYGYIDPEHGSTAKWLNETNYTWHCNIPSSGEGENSSCGVSLSWSQLFNTQEVDTPPVCEREKTDEQRNTSENQRTCEALTNSKVKKEHPQKPCKNPQSDVDNDGLGLEYGQICLIINNEMDIPLCGEHLTQNYNNGWGRERGTLCKTKQSTPPKNVNTPEISLKRIEKEFRSIDFSRYDNLNLKVHYEGRADYLRIYLRNSDPIHTVSKNHNSAKFMGQTILSEDLTTGIFQVKLADFSVAEWWTIDHPLSRKWSGPKLEYITSLGIDHISSGVHKVRLDKIELTGEWIKKEQLLVFISICWALYLLIETLIRYSSLRKTLKLNYDEIDQLTSHTILLEVERNQLKQRSITDELTGIFNRDGIAEFADRLFDSGKKKLALMIIDIDHFKRVNDTYGHDTGDHILKSLTELILSNIRDNDVLGRWGGEEFILICPQTNTQQLMSLGEKLCTVVEQQSFTEKLKLKITISIGATSITKADTFNTAFKRADIALYTAKEKRNMVSLQL